VGNLPRYYTPQENDYLESMLQAWQNGVAGRFDKAMDSYEAAQHCGLAEVSPATQLLRYDIGKANGIVRAIEPTEDSVVVLEMSDDTPVANSFEGLTNPVIDREVFAENIRRYRYQCRDHHMANIHTQMPHVMVMSTGRCGTVSMLRLFNNSDYVPHHTYTYNTPARDRMEMMCRMMTTGGDDSIPGMMAEHWLMSRSAEWLGSMEEGRRFMGLNHMDTIYAPLFALVHPQSRFIYLRRDPVKIFESFYSKNQWNHSQLRPLAYTFDGDFKYLEVPMNLPERLAWYIRFTEEFSRAMGDVLGPRFVEISADKLFNQDIEEIEKLLDFTETNITMGQALGHFSKPVNVKAHKAKRDPGPAREEFEKAYRRML